MVAEDGVNDPVFTVSEASVAVGKTPTAVFWQSWAGVKNAR